MGRLDSKVAVVSGAARGQGRSHAMTLAREGASIVAFDACSSFAYPMTPPATEEDLAETVRGVEGMDQRCLSEVLDARDSSGLEHLAARTREEFGRVDILVINHGIWSIARNTWETPEEQWNELVDVLLTGVYKVCRAFMPLMIESGGGSVIMTSSSNAIQPGPSSGAYTAAKTGVVGLMRVMAVEAGEFNIRVNAIAPGGVNTKMLQEGGTMEQSLEWRPEFLGQNKNLLPNLQWLEPQAISDAVLFLASDESKFVTGVLLPVDAGWTVG